MLRHVTITLNVMESQFNTQSVYDFANIFLIHVKRKTHYHVFLSFSLTRNLNSHFKTVRKAGSVGSQLKTKFDKQIEFVFAIKTKTFEAT